MGKDKKRCFEFNVTWRQIAKIVTLNGIKNTAVFMIGLLKYLSNMF
jgi:N-glycosylase/DNA lyase